jgi:hypothetical protein
MRNNNNDELNTRIRTFLDKQIARVPEVDQDPAVVEVRKHRTQKSAWKRFSHTISTRMKGLL